jgi:hypothetical protein
MGLRGSCLVVVGFDDPLHERMPDDVLAAEPHATAATN